MSEITQFKIVGPDDLFEILVVKRINTLEISTNFNPGEYPEFTKGIKDHPYIKTLFEATMAENKTADLPYGYMAVVYDNYDFEIFHEDLQTLMEVYLYENTQPMAPEVGATK